MSPPFFNRMYPCPDPNATDSGFLRCAGPPRELFRW